MTQTQKGRTIQVLEYNPVWPVHFEEEKATLAIAIGGQATCIEHIGSTSVIGLAAKPIIDILIEVGDINLLEQRTPQMEALGYLAKGEHSIPGRRYFQKGGLKRTHHVHAFQTGSQYLTEHRAFKHYLRAHPDVSNRYSQIKKTAAATCNNDINQYMHLKSDFVEYHLKLALMWYKVQASINKE